MSCFNKIICVVLGIFCLSLSVQAELRWDSKMKELFPSLLTIPVGTGFPEGIPVLESVEDIQNTAGSGETNAR